MSMMTIILHSIGYFQLQKVQIKGPKLIIETKEWETWQYLNPIK